MLRCRRGSGGITFIKREVAVQWLFFLLLSVTGITLIFGQAEPAQAEVFFPTGSMGAARQDFTATLLDDGTVLITGGLSTSAARLNTAEIYDSSSGTFSPTNGTMATARQHHTATKLANGKVLISGGVNNSGTPVSSAELYDPVTKTFTATGSMNSIRRNHTATYLPAINKVLITGGRTGTTSGTTLSSAELFDPAGNSNVGTFTPTANPMTRVRTYHTASLLAADGKVLITGGLTTSGASTATAELYDPGADTFTVTGSMNVARNYHAAVVLNNGKVLITGGSSGSSGASLATAELYDSGSFAFTAGDMNVAGHSRHTATLLANGNVMVAGDFSSLGVPQVTADIYNVDNNNFNPTGFAFMGTSRSNFSGVLLPSGKVLLAGGASGFLTAPTALAELFIQSPGVTVAPDRHTFPDTSTGSTSAAQTFTISTDFDMAIAPFSITGTDSTMFTVSPTTNCSPQPYPFDDDPYIPSLLAGGSCTVSVTFTPTSIGVKSASLDIITNDPNIPTRSIVLSGTGVILTSTVTVTFAGSGTGSVHSSSVPTQAQQISCQGSSGTLCQQQFPNGTQVTLTPTVDSNSLFIWSGACTVTGDNCVINNLSANTAVTATFNYIKPAKIVRTQLSYDTLQGAYDAALTGDVIQARAFTFTEPLVVFNGNIAITVDGGYDLNYSPTSEYSVLDGVLNIRNGKVTVKKLIIR